MIVHEHGMHGDDGAGNRGYNRVVRFAVDELEDGLSRHADTPMAEPYFMGLVIALSRLASGPQRGVLFEAIQSDRLARMKSMFEEWWKKFGKKVKVGSTASREAVYEEAMLEWDYMLHLYAGYRFPEPARMPLSTSMSYGDVKGEFQQRKAERAKKRKSAKKKD